MRNAIATLFGGSGFIGRYVVQRLAARGVRIKVVTRDPHTALHLKPLGEVGQIVPVAWPREITAEALTPLVAGSRLVVNFVGILHERRRGDFRRVHEELAGAVAAAARAAGVARLVHISALGADPASPSAYARTKALGEVRVRDAFPGATILRPSVVFGPEDRFFNRFAAMSQISPVLPVVGPETRFQPVYVGDVADAVVAALAGEEAVEGPFELGGPRVYTFAELLRYVLAVTGRRRLLLPVPFGLAEVLAGFLEWLPEPPLTRDQVRLLRRDNVVSGTCPGLDALGVAATPVEVVVPRYLAAFRRGGVRLRTV